MSAWEAFWSNPEVWSIMTTIVLQEYMKLNRTTMNTNADYVNKYSVQNGVKGRPFFSFITGHFYEKIITSENWALINVLGFQ